MHNKTDLGMKSNFSQTGKADGDDEINQQVLIMDSIPATLAITLPSIVYS